MSNENIEPADTYDSEAETRALLAPSAAYDDTEETRAALAKPSGPDASTMRTVMRVWYSDGSKSKGVNPNRPAALLVFEARWGHAQPENVRETMWLIWHILGRPGPSGGPHRADGDADAAFDDWFLSVEELDTYQEERGKASA